MSNPMHLPEFDACPVHSALRALGIGRIKIQCPCIGFCLISLEKVNAHLLTSIYSLERLFTAQKRLFMASQPFHVRVNLKLKN